MIDIDIDIDNDMTYNIQTEEYKTATTCGILVKNIFDGATQDLTMRV